MSMIKCSECGKDISDKAKTCPHCGAPIKSLEQQKKTKMIIAITSILLGIIVLLVCIVVGIKVKEKKDAQKAEQIALTPTAINLNTTSMTLNVNDEDALSYEIQPETAQNDNVKWESSDKNIVSIDNGKIKALSEGTATITVYTSNGLSSVCNITITDKEGHKKEAVDNLYQYIKDNSTDLDDGVKLLYIDKKSDDNWVALGVDGTNICVCSFYETPAPGDKYKVTIKFDSSFESASFKYLYVYKLLFSSHPYNGAGTINLKNYKYGDQVTLDYIKNEDDTEIPIPNSDQTSVNSYVKICLKSFVDYLTSHPEIGCSPDDLQISFD